MCLGMIFYSLGGSGCSVVSGAAVQGGNLKHVSRHCRAIVVPRGQSVVPSVVPLSFQCRATVVPASCRHRVDVRSMFVSGRSWFLNFVKVGDDCFGKWARPRPRRSKRHKNVKMLGFRWVPVLH